MLEIRAKAVIRIFKAMAATRRFPPNEDEAGEWCSRKIRKDSVVTREFVLTQAVPARWFSLDCCKRQFARTFAPQRSVFSFGLLRLSRPIFSAGSVRESRQLFLVAVKEI